MRVGLLVCAPSHERVEPFGPTERDDEEVEARASATTQRAAAAEISRVLAGSGHRVTEIIVDRYFAQRLQSADVDIVFNTYPGRSRRAEQFLACALMEFLSVRFTGSSSRTHALGLAKHTAKKVLAHDGLPTPAFFTVSSMSDPVRCDLRFPVIVKPACEGSSMGIFHDNVVDHEDALARVLARTLANYGAPALIEEFIEGREFTVGVLGNSPPRAMPVAELDFSRLPRSARAVYSRDAKRRDLVPLKCPAQVPGALEERLQELAVRAFRSLDCHDYARVDFRVDAGGRAYVLEVNTLPGLKHGYSDFPRIAAAAGYSYPELILNLLDIAVRRYGLEPSSPSTAPPPGL